MFQLAQETVKPTETAILEAIIKSILTDQKNAQKPGQIARRDVHAKSHGTVKATFTVLSGLPSDLAIGLFADPRSYDAVIRFSNGTPTVGPDVLPNVRGIALKLQNVPGKKILVGQENSSELDFLLANHPTFFIADVENYVPVHDLVSHGQLGALFKQYPADAKRLMRSVLKLVKNPLTATYCSQSPYLFGEGKAVKYGLFPAVSSSVFSLPNVFDKDYLRHAIEKSLIKTTSEFTFCVQFQGEQDSIEDSSVEWTGPFVALAKVVVAERGSEPLLESSGEKLSFNPWRTFAQHRPLGWANRLREGVYRADYEFRQRANSPG